MKLLTPTPICGPRVWISAYYIATATHVVAIFLPPLANESISFLNCHVKPILLSPFFRQY